MNHFMMLIKISLFMIVALSNIILPQSADEMSKVANTKNKQIQKLDFGDFVYDTEFSPDGTVFAASGYDVIVKLWDTKNWQLLFELKQAELVNEIAFSPSSKILATVTNELAKGGLSNTKIWFWDVKTGENIAIYKEDNVPRGGIASIAYSPNGKVMGVGFSKGLVKLIDVENLSDIKVINENFPNLDSSIMSLSFSPDGRQLAISTGATGRDADSGNIRVLDVKTGNTLLKLKEFGVGFSTAFSTDGKILVVSGSNYNRKTDVRDTSLIFYSTNDWKEIRKLDKFPAGYGGLAFSKDGKLLVSAGSDEYEEGYGVWLLDMNQMKVVKKYSGSSSIITSMAMSSDSKLIALGDEDGKIKIYENDK